MPDISQRISEAASVVASTVETVASAVPQTHSTEAIQYAALIVGAVIGLLALLLALASRYLPRKPPEEE